MLSVFLPAGQWDFQQLYLIVNIFFVNSREAKRSPFNPQKAVKQQERKKDDVIKENSSQVSVLILLCDSGTGGDTYICKLGKVEWFAAFFQ